VIIDARGGDIGVAKPFLHLGDVDARRCRIVLPPSPRCLSASRQAMMWARVTVRNSSGRAMPVKRMKSRTAFS
jgi:hypothetical protein